MENILINSIKTSLIDREIESSDRYQHKLISNREEKIISLLRRELEECEEFIISVAFITMSGVTMILEQLRELDKRGVKGKILTGDYLNFTQPKALKKLLEFKNIELKILSTEKFHAKGYFFKKGNIWSMMIGSSNLTQTALTTNFEWNLMINSLESGRIIKDTLENFYEVFNGLENLTIEKIIEYENVYEFNREYRERRKEKELKEEKIKPNMMQIQALENLRVLRKYEKRGLLISATGTGKTYLSAFDVQNCNPKRVLFIAHRKTILEKAKETFEKILKEREIIIYSNDENREADIVFAMIQTLGKEENFRKFPRDYFDYIVIDEVHHSGAKTYQNLINYFIPKFLLGMTATPERGDNFDIYKLFDNNIAYEIRLYDALKESLLCPFHYFGVSDIEINGEIISEKTHINKLVVSERVEHILEKSRFYGYSGDKLHGLIFVSRVEEAIILSEKFRERGVRCEALKGDDSDEKREKTIKKLEDGEIEYIVTVDIFNEGVDIPCINQVILLRPTQSSIVYIQQLGRGLRKYKNKEYLVILDFIGNYEKNFLIPIAISQNNSFDKDYMKRFLVNGTNIIPGESSIIFEEIVKERIFDNINKNNFSTKKNIEKDFIFLEKQLGRIPMLSDFFERNMIDPSVILKYKKTYDEVLRILKPKLELEPLNQKENNYLTFLSSFFTPAKRVHEMLILKEALINKDVNIEIIEKILENEYSLKNQKESVENGVKHLLKEIFVSLSTAKEFYPILERYGDKIVLAKDFFESYSKNSYFKDLIDDLIKYNLAYSSKHYKQVGEKSILKYKEYSKQEAFWYLNLDFNNGYQVSGYTVFEEARKVILFITVDNDLDMTQYDNVFYDRRKFVWFSKNKRCLKRDGKLTAEGKIAENYYTLEAFLKRKTGENFYYIGEIETVLEGKDTINYKGNSVVEYLLLLKDEIENDLYQYVVKNSSSK